MSEGTSFCVVVAGGAFCITGFSRCETTKDEIAARRASEERAQMIAGGYALKLIPGKEEPVWEKEAK